MPAGRAASRDAGDAASEAAFRAGRRSDGGPLTHLYLLRPGRVLAGALSHVRPESNGVMQPMLFRFHDAADRERASDGVSRYGVYLRQHADRFDWEEPVTTDPALFSRAAWEVATSPIMSPPFLDWTAERVQEVAFSLSEHDASLIARVQVAVPRPAALADVRGFAEWDRGERWNRGYFEPYGDALARRPAMLTSTTLLFAIPRCELYAPQNAPELTVRDAKQAVKRLAAVLDERLAPIVAALDAAPAGATW
jgi:hypothetical protein